MRSVLVHFFGERWHGMAEPIHGPQSGMRAWNSRKNGSLSDQAERTRALGGPWKLEEKANFWHSPFTVQKNEIIDMVCSFGNIIAPLPKS